jgi:hypothetical protein
MLTVLALLAMHTPNPRFRKPRYRLPINRRFRAVGK